MRIDDRKIGAIVTGKKLVIALDTGIISIEGGTID